MSMSRGICCSLIGLAFSSAALAAVPPLIAAQGLLRNGAGTPVDGAYDLLLSLHDAPQGGTLLWSQTFTALPVVEGRFQATLGAGLTPLPVQALAAAAGLYLGVAIANEPEFSRVQLVSTPYSLISASASTAAMAADLQCTACVGPGDLAPGAVSAAAVTYSPVTSGLAADTTQEAIDELATQVATLADFVSSELQAPSGAVVPPCAAATQGRLFLDETTGQLLVCVGGTWQSIGKGNARLEFTPVSLDFDLLAVTKLSATLRNAGDAAALAVNLSASGDFTVAHDCPATLSPGVACTATFEMKLGTGKLGKLTGTGTATATGGLAAAVSLAGSPPPPRTCKEHLTSNPGLADGLYTIDADGAGGEGPTTVYCDMTTDGGGWTLAAYCAQAPGQQNFWDLRCGGGSYDGLSRSSCASLPSVSLARRSTEMLLARSDSNGQTGNVLAYAVANKFTIPDPENVNFVNHSRYGPFTGTDTSQRGPCTAVTLTTLKGANATGAVRYTFRYSLGVSWDDSYPTGYGVNPNSSCLGTWSQGPFFTSVHSGSGHSSSGNFTNACVVNGSPGYNHQAWYDPGSANKSGSASIWFR